MAVEEDVDAFADGGGESDNTVGGGFTVEDTDEVGEVVEDRQIVLDDDDIVVWS